mgnify:CR=1 FL=1
MTSKRKRRRAIPMVVRGELEDFLARAQRAQRVVDGMLAQIKAHGPGPTFGELAIGECFDWAPPLRLGREPLVKTSATRYEWSRGTGTAEDFHRVERWTEVGRSASGDAGTTTAPVVGRRPADTNEEG